MWPISVSLPLRNALSVALSDPIFGLYADNVSAPLGVHAGLRHIYKFGHYRHCAYVNKTNGSCSGIHAGYRFRPYKIITDDMPSNYSDYTHSIIGDIAFANSPSLGRRSHAAYGLLLLGTLFAALSALMSVRSRSNWSRTWLTSLCSAQDFLGAHRSHHSRLHSQYICSHRCNNLDSHHQKRGTHQFIHTPTFPNSHRHTCVW